MLFVSQYCYHMIYQRSLFEVFRSNDNFLVRLPDIHLVPSPWVLLHMIHWVLSSVTCKLPLVLAIIFISWHSLVDDHIFFKHVWFSPFRGIRHENISFMTVDDFFMKSSFANVFVFIVTFLHLPSLSFHHDHSSFVNIVNLTMSIYIRCQHSLTVDHWWCFHVILFEHRYVGVEFPKSIFSCMTHTSSRHLFIGVGLKWSSCTLVNKIHPKNWAPVLVYSRVRMSVNRQETSCCNNFPQWRSLNVFFTISSWYHKV